MGPGVMGGRGDADPSAAIAADRAECPRCGYGSMTHTAEGDRCPECSARVPAGSIMLRAESVGEAAWFPRRGVRWLAIGGGGFVLLLMLALLIVFRMQGGGAGGGRFFVVPWYVWGLYLLPIGQFVLLPALMRAGRPRWLIVEPGGSVAIWGHRGRAIRVTPRRVHAWSVSRPEQGAIYFWVRLGLMRRLVHGRFRLGAISRDELIGAIEAAFGRAPVGDEASSGHDERGATKKARRGSRS